jgi:DNA-binding NarL/FixJ family response regulator
VSRSDSVSVLIVDDQPRFLTVAATVVERTAGFRVVGRAGNGAEAVVQASTLRPQLVLMDINMPVLDGIAAARQIVDELPGVTVVLLSSYDRDDLPDGFASSGAAGYLHKEELDPVALRRVWDEHGQLDRSS